MLNVLDEVLLSDEVCKDFYERYSDPEFRSWLMSVLPEVDECRKQEQDNPWHIYDCLEHILHSVEEINKQTKNMPEPNRRKLAYTMFLHDIGKPEKHLRRYSKLYRREVDSFYNHNMASKDIADRVLEKDFGFDHADAEQIKMLVEKHDIFMFVTLQNDHNPYHKVLTPGYIAEQEGDLAKVGNGQTLMSELIMIGRADNLAQNPKMTKDSLHMLDVMEKMQTKMHSQTPPAQ